MQNRRRTVFDERRHAQTVQARTTRDRIRSNTTQCRVRGSRRRQRRRLKTGAARCAPGTPPARACSCPYRPFEAPTEKRPQGDDPMNTNRIIRRCKRKSCGHVWARQYETAPNTRAPFRIDESGKRVFASDSYEWTCPKCNSQCVTGNTVQGFISEHKCGAKCLSAIGPNCECSCGGANHGTNWL
jgi:hypothetical protein